MKLTSMGRRMSARAGKRKAFIAAGLLAAAAFPMASYADFETLSSQPAPTGNPFSTASFSGGVSLTFGYEDNVFLVADESVFFPAGADTASGYVEVVGWIGDELRLSETMTVGAVVTIGSRSYSAVQNPDFALTADTFSFYDRLSFEPRLYLRITPDDRWTFTPSLTFRSEDAELAAIGLASHQLRLDASYAYSAQTRVDGYVLVARNAFEVDFPGIASRDRDGSYYAAGIEVRHALPGNRQAFTLGLEIEHNDSRGSDWDFSGYSLSAGFDTHLGGRFYGLFGVSYDDRQYDGSFADLAPTGRTSQQIVTAEAGIIYVIDRQYAVRADLRHMAYDSNTPAFAGDATEASISFVMTFP